ncbi:hypothetical protein ACFQ87_43405, partial [Kitasatospora sp. NPDC056531]
MSEISRENTTATVRPKRRRLGWVAVPALAGGLALAAVLSSGGGTPPVKPAQAPIAAPAPSSAKAQVVPASAVELLDHVAQVAASRPAGDRKTSPFFSPPSTVTHKTLPPPGKPQTYNTPHKRE